MSPESRGPAPERPAPESQSPTTDTYDANDSTIASRAEFGSVLRLGDPEVVAAELIERVGPGEARRIVAWVLLLAEEVAS